jgi:Mg2+ and Co2+ transporter CorA
MIRSFLFSDGKLAGSDLDREALRLLRVDRGLRLWGDLDNPTNEGIKFLTATTAVTIPVTVIGTWSGMNFPSMPELKNSYPWAVGVMVVTTLMMVIYLKKKKWS